jgi:hypothetical protein
MVWFAKSTYRYNEAYRGIKREYALRLQRYMLKQHYSASLTYVRPESLVEQQQVCAVCLIIVGGNVYPVKF